MSLWKVIVIAALISLLLFIGSLVYALYPTIRNVSKKEQLAPFIKKDLVLKKDVFIYIMEEGNYHFEPLLLSAKGKYPYEKKLMLPEGTKIRIEKFKTFRRSGRTVMTELYAIGSSVLRTGEKIRFEYEWGNVNQPGNLKLAPWQDSTDLPVFFALDERKTLLK